MINKRIFPGVLLISAAFCATSIYGQTEKDGAPLSITLSLPKSEFSLGEEMIATVVYKNNSKEPVPVLKLTGWGYPLTFDIVDSQGRHSAMIKIARNKFFVNYDKDFIELQPNESFTQQYVFHEMFYFPLTDRYTVTATYSSVWGLPETKSNAVPADILGERDIEDIVQFVLNIDDLQAFFHPELPGRKPLVLFKNQFFLDSPELIKFGEPVLFMTKEELEANNIQNYVEFKQLNYQGGTMEIYLQYPLEGLSGKIWLVKKNNAWDIKDKQIFKTR